MHIYLHKLEKFVDIIIAPLLLALVVIIIGEIFYSEQFENYSNYVDYFDIILVLIFATDLSFKYNRIRKVPEFIKKNWIEIFATIPFFLIFRFIELFGITELLERGQTVAHEIPEVAKLEKEGVAIVKEAGRTSRTIRLIRTFRIASRFPRFLKVIPFYEKPTGNHHWYEKKR